MKIIYISNSIIPSRTANSIHVMKMCHAFAKLNNEVFLIAPDNQKFEKGIIDVYSFYGVEKNFEIVYLPQRKMKGAGVLFSFKISKYISKIKPDLIYGRFLSGCFISSLFNNIPVAFEAHQPIYNSGFLQNVFFKALIKKSKFKKLVVISNSLKKYYMKAYKLQESSIVVAHDGADEITMETEAEIQSSNQFDVGYIGHLYKGKGMELIAEIAKKSKWAKFHIVGGTEKDINFWKNELREIDNICFYGYIPHSDVHKYGSTFDILLAPYLKKVYGYTGGSDLSSWMSPLKIFEYMSMGKAIVSSDLPVLREILTHNRNALLCDPDNVDEWVKALKILKKDKIYRDMISRNAKLDFLDKFTWKSRADLIMSNILERSN